LPNWLLSKDELGFPGNDHHRDVPSEKSVGLPLGDQGWNVYFMAEIALNPKGFRTICNWKFLNNLNHETSDP
jgi:hypothetical protein